MNVQDVRNMDVWGVHEAGAAEESVHPAGSQERHAAGVPEPSGQTQAQDTTQAPPDTANTVAEVVKKLDTQLKSHDVALKFRIHEDTGQVQVEVLNAENDKVVRKIPADELLKLSASLDELAGKLFNKAL